LSWTPAPAAPLVALAGASAFAWFRAQGPGFRVSGVGYEV
jgi:hypothetical protein